jgi:Fe-S oxidoreductase
MAQLAAQGKTPEYLFWVGCAGSYDERYKKVTRAFAKILDHLEISYAILGDEESCTGDPAKRAGNEFLFQMQAMQNIEILNGYGVKKIFTACPHCFNTLKNEYPDFGGNYEVTHHTQFLVKMLRDNRLQLQADAFDSKRIAFHDPCYLGRGNNEYEAPRELLDELTSDLLEMQRNRQNSFCCGAGGAQLFKEPEKGTKDINIERTEEALALNPDVIATACPFCMLMLSDGVKMKNREEVKVLDLAELIAQAQNL